MAMKSSLHTPLLWKVGLHVQSEDHRVFDCAEPSLFSYHLFLVFLGSEIGEMGAGSASRVLNDRRRRPSSLRRETNEGRQQELARGHKKSCKCFKESILRRLVPVTYLFVGPFGEGT